MPLSKIPNSMQAALTDAEMPSGSLINVYNSGIATGASSNSSSFVKFITAGTYTTTMANSKLLIQVDVQTQTGNVSQTNSIGVFNLRHSLDSYSSDLIRFAHANYRDVSGSNGWNQPTPTFSALHVPNVAAGTSIEYQIWGRASTGNGSIYVNDQWGQSSTGNFIVQEIVP